MARRKYRKASEIGEFVYCHQAWWLHHIRGFAPTYRERLEAGRVNHDRHSAAVRRAALVRQLALLLGIAAAILFGVWWFW
jgi:hypothetical protein